MRIEVGDQDMKKVSAVLLDGHVLTGCLAADDQEGWVKELVPDPAKPGYFMHDGVQFLTRERRGSVQIVLKDTSRDWDKSRTGKAKVQVGREPTSGDILVQVFSIARPGAIKQMRMERLHLPSGTDRIAQKAGIAAGAAAELLAEQFGDAIDPSDAAQAAIGSCTEMLLAEGGGKGSNLILDQSRDG